MTTSLYSCDTVVEIAFNAGFGTPAGSRTWTDVSQWVEFNRGFTITWGRQDERGVADANQLSGLVLDNSDGRFTAARVTSPYYPNVKLDRPIRITSTPVDGPAVVEFLGYINEWPLEWSEGTANSAYTTLSASSRLSRLGYTAQLPALLDVEVAKDDPWAIYKLNEPAGSTTAANSSVNILSSLSVYDPAYPPTFGVAAPLERVAVAFNSSTTSYLAGYIPIPITGGLTVECFFQTTVAGVGISQLNFGGSILQLNLGASVGASIVVVDAATLASTTVTGGAASLADGVYHHMAVRWASSELTVLVDGVQVGTTAVVVAAPASTNSARVAVGRDATVMAHDVTIFGHLVTAARIAVHSGSGLTGFSGETTDARIIRYAGLVNIPTAEIAAEAGSTTVQHVDTASKQVVELMRDMESTEGGVLFDARDGTLTFHNRAHRYVATSAFTLDMGKHHVETGYAPKLDRTYILNDVTAQDTSGRYTAHVVDTQSRDTDYGPMTAQLETASEDDDAPLQAASWLVYISKQPSPRVPACSVDALAQVGTSPSCSQVMAVTVGTRITVGGHPQQMSYSSVDYFVEGGTRVYGPESLMLTWNLSPASPYADVLIVADPVRGVVGTNPVAY